MTDPTSTGETRIVIVEDHTLVRQSVVRILSAEPGMHVVGQSGSAHDVAPLVARTRPHIVVMDVGLPGASGLDVAADIRARCPGVRIVFLTMHDDDATVARAIALGCDGYLLKTATTDELLGALRAVAAGGSYLSPQVTRSVMRRAGRIGRSTDLTDRELDVLRALAAGARPVTVARELYVSVKTVRNHLASIYVKLGVETAAQAIAEAFRRGLVSHDGVRL